MKSFKESIWTWEFIVLLAGMAWFIGQAIYWYIMGTPY